MLGTALPSENVTGIEPTSMLDQAMRARQAAGKRSSMNGVWSPEGRWQSNRSLIGKQSKFGAWADNAILAKNPFLGFALGSLGVGNLPSFKDAGGLIQARLGGEGVPSPTFTSPSSDILGLSTPIGAGKLGELGVKSSGNKLGHW